MILRFLISALQARAAAPKRARGTRRRLLILHSTFLFLYSTFPILHSAPPSPSLATGEQRKNFFASIPVSFNLPGFNDAGHRTFLLSGDQAMIIDSRQIDIRGLSFTQYPGDGSAIAQTSITAPAASVFMQENKQAPRIAGKDGVRLTHENDLEATGDDWSYDHARQKLTINKNARIICLNADFGMPNTGSQTPAGRDAPLAPVPRSTTITADSLELTQDETTNTTLATLNGNVTVTTSAGHHLACDHLEITATRLRDKDPSLKPPDKFQLLTATGNVRLTQDGRSITCGRADILPREDRVTLTQAATVSDAALRMTAKGDPLTLHRADRRIEGNNVHLTLPGVDFGTQNTDSPTQSPTQPLPQSEQSEIRNPQSEIPTTITARTLTLWETPDALTHAILEGNVTVTATDTHLDCERAELAFDGTLPGTTPDNTPTPRADKTQPAPRQPLAPLRRLLATGNVHLTHAGREATAGQAEVLPREDKIILTQNPVLTDRAISATASAGTFTLRRHERRLTAIHNVLITLPNTDFETQNADSPTQSPTRNPKSEIRNPKSAPSATITARTLTLWETPDALTHAILEHDVRLAAADLDLACNHLAIDATPAKPARLGDKNAPPDSVAHPVPPQIQNQQSKTETPSPPALDPRLETAAARILSMVATGAVRFKQNAREATCERTDIVPPEDRITLTGSPRIIDRTKPDAPVLVTGDKLTLRRGQETITGENIKITPAPAPAPPETP